MNTNGMPLSNIIELMADHVYALTHTAKGYPKAGENEERARNFLAQLGLLDEQRSRWTAYKPGDGVPIARFYWVALSEGRGLHIAERDKEKFCIDDHTCDISVTHYIAIATPEPPQ
jgi:hypothetical protein